MPAIRFLRSEVNQLTPAGNELLEFSLFFGSFLEGCWLHFFGEEGQDAGIDPIGLGHQAEGSCEVACPLGIDYRNSITGVQEIGDDFPLVAASGFEDDQAVGRGRENLT
jgi:hypothetical protein